MELLGWQWQYGIISRCHRVPRPKGWFSSGQYVAVRIDDKYLPGRVIETIGDHPPFLKICMYQGRNICSDHPDHCGLVCRKQLFTTADHAGVLNLEDMLFVLENKEPRETIDPRYDILAGQKSTQLFNLIERLEARQKIC